MNENAGDIGIVGLGVMGANLARNFASRGHRVVAWTRTLETAHRLAASHPEAKLVIAPDVASLVRSLKRPRCILAMVPAGNPVDSVLDALDPLLEADDVVVDGGNSLFSDTDRRAERAAGAPGVSSGWASPVAPKEPCSVRPSCRGVTGVHGSGYDRCCSRSLRPAIAAPVSPTAGPGRPGTS